MIYKFKSKATGDLILLEPAGRRVLGIVGKSPEAKGILLAEHIPGAVAALEAAILADDAARKRAAESAGNAPEADLAPGDAVTLRQRAKPFLDMLRRSHGAGEDVVWGV